LNFLAWIEATAIATWVRESISLWAYPSILAFHAVGLGFLVGSSVVIDLRLLGVGDRLPIDSVRSFFPVAWAGFWINAFTGVLLLSAAATSMFANSVFVTKLVLVMLAVVALRWKQIRVFKRGDPNTEAVARLGRKLAILSLVLWSAAIITGRATAYTLLLASTFGIGN